MNIIDGLGDTRNNFITNKQYAKRVFYGPDKEQACAHNDATNSIKSTSSPQAFHYVHEFSKVRHQ